jgi:hypothetical protein
MTARIAQFGETPGEVMPGNRKYRITTCHCCR